MADAVSFPDLEDEIRIHLADIPAFSTVTIAAGTKPSTISGRFIFIGRTGGFVSSHVIDTAQITIECYSSTSVDAFHLASAVRTQLHLAALSGYIHSAVVSSVSELSAIYRDPDSTVADMFRYSATYRIAARGRVAD
ncbi:MAG: hypothetical protein ACKOAF_05450 [Actinomycetes bacterium]